MELWKFDSNVVSKNMLALQSYEQNNGFSAMSTDEFLEINGGSGSKEPEPFIEYDPESDSVNVGVRIPKD